MDFVDYRPAAHVLDRLRQVNFLAVVGPTAAGKSTLIKRSMAREPQLRYVLGSTSRAPRPGEQNGVDYHFCTREEMLARIERGEFVQVAPSVLGDLYATAPEDYSTNGVAVYAAIAQAIPVFHSLPFKSMRTVFVIPPSWEEWQKRLAKHHFRPEQLAKRMAEARRSLEFALHDRQTRYIINGSLQQATQDFIDALSDTPPTVCQQTDQSRAKEIARDILNRHL